MKKLLITLISAILITGLIACSSKSEQLLEQYAAADDPSVLFTDVETSETVLLDDSNYKITLDERTADRIKDEVFGGFCFTMRLENNTSNNVRFKFNEIKVNGELIPQDKYSPNVRQSVSAQTQQTGFILLRYEELATYGIDDIDDVSFVLEVVQDDGSNNIIYTSDKIKFKPIETSQK